MDKKSKSKKMSPVKKILLIGLLCVVGIFIILVGINVYVCLRADAYICDEIEDLPSPVDAIIVPGAGLEPDGSPGVILDDRLDTAIQLYKNGISDKLLMSGDHDEYHNEVKAMMDYAIENGVPSEDILLDHSGFNTYDTMYRARSVYHIRSAVIVTQMFHLYRSVYIAKKLGMKAYGYPSAINVGELKYFPLEIREFFARVKEFFTMIYHPLPTETD